MAILSNGKFYGFLCSVKETGRKLANGVKEYVEDFVSGFSGHGWKLWEYATGKWKLEIDTIVVRETMLIFEMLISKIRAIIGSQAITQGHGKVKSVRLSEAGTEYLIELEDEDISIDAHDFVRCQTFTGNSTKLYHVEVAFVDVGTKTLYIPLSEFDQDESGAVLNPPAAGDELIQFGNSQNKARQSAIYMHADETGQPAIDVMFDLDSKNWNGKVKVRVGGEIPGTNGLRGFYCVNGLIKGVDDKGVVVYEFAPDGTVNIGRGNIRYNPTTNKVTLGSGVTLTWDNLDDETKENLKGEKGDKGDKGDQGLQGLQGEKGETGIAGDTGADGRTSYFHIKYSAVSNPTSSDQISETPNVYIGTYVDYTQADSTEPSKYVWARFQGIQGNHGEQGIPGINGEDGTTYYLHIKYSDDGGQTFTADNGEASGAWIGVCTNTDINDPTNVEAYKWSKIKGDTGPQGVPGEPGKDGKVYYTWIRYADSADGSGISNNPTGKKYMGLAYNRETSVESNTPGDYTWSLFRGEDGHDGVQGPAGADGKTTYTWIAYSDYSDGRDMYQIPNDNTRYIGIAINKETSVESNTPSDYTWSKFRGEDGEDANLLPWIEKWNGYATELGEDYIVTPKMFSGTKTVDADGKVLLTGIAQGKDCLTAADGTKRTGIFALVNNEIVFELDPINGTYKFTGNIVSNSIEMKDYAYLASAIFCGDYLFSQQGIDNNGLPTNEFSRFNPNDPHSGLFKPNYAINFKTGDQYSNGGHQYGFSNNAFIKSSNSINPNKVTYGQVNVMFDGESNLEIPNDKKFDGVEFVIVRSANKSKDFNNIGIVNPVETNIMTGIFYKGRELRVCSMKGGGAFIRILTHWNGSRLYGYIVGHSDNFAFISPMLGDEQISVGQWFVDRPYLDIDPASVYYNNGAALLFALSAYVGTYSPNISGLNFNKPS